MIFLQEFEFSHWSLLACLIVPFFYFGYHGRYWYRPDLCRRFDFVFGLFIAVVAIAVVLKLAVTPRTIQRDAFLLGFLHLLPLVQTLLVLKGVKGAKPAAAKLKEGGKGYEQFNPQPLTGMDKTGWDELVISESLRGELLSVIELLKDPRQAKRYGIEVPKGILFNGPPGNGKTTIARAVASTAELSFFVLKMDEVISKWVGESEKNLSLLFSAAQRNAPSVIFVDEIDSIGKRRSGTGSSQWSENLLNHLLQLIDGIVKTEGLYVIGATNRADLVDSALKRAGRLSKVIEIPLPDLPCRRQLFSLYLSKLALEADVDIQGLADATEGKSCADIKEICNQAGLNAFRRESGTGSRHYEVTVADLEKALLEWAPGRAG